MRWKCAWDSLVAKGWVVLAGELGFVVPPEAVIVGAGQTEVREGGREGREGGWEGAGG